MKVRYTRRALENLTSIALYLNARSPQAALNVREDIEQGIRHLITFPRSGRRQTTEQVRKFVTRKYAYLIYYTLSDRSEEIIILSVRHHAQRREHRES